MGRWWDVGYINEITRYLNTVTFKFPQVETGGKKNIGMHEIKSSHRLKEPIPKVAQEFEKRVNKFSDLGVVPGRHDWYVILRKKE